MPAFVCLYVRSFLRSFVGLFLRISKICFKNTLFSQVAFSFVRSIARSLVRSLVCLHFKKIPLKKFHFLGMSVCGKQWKIMIFRTLARPCGNAVVRSRGCTFAHTHAHTHARTMPVVYISPNLGKMISLLKKYLGKKTQITSGILYMRESKIQLLLELILIDGDLIIYAEFDKTRYKRWYTIVWEITSRNFGFACFLLGNLTSSQTEL